MEKRTHSRPQRNATWQTQLAKLLAEHNGKASRSNKIVGERTKDKRAHILYLSFQRLWDDGYKIQNPHNLKESHVHHLATEWEKEGASPATLQNRLSILRIYAEWIGKPGMIKASEKYVSDPEKIRRQYVAVEDKSWTTKGVDIEKMLIAVSAYDRHCAMQIKLIRAFGLRRQEGVAIKPLRADKGQYLLVTDGTKGGRDRVVPIETEYQKQVLAESQALAAENRGFISDRSLNLKQALRRLTYVMERYKITKKVVGTTLHGLRHEFANDSLERKGFISPVRGGQVAVEEKDKEKLARLAVSEELGHSRESITTAYYGTRKRKQMKPTNPNYRR